jgi:hypothetical protein
MSMEKLAHWELAGETEVLGENGPQCDFIHHKSQRPDLGLNPVRRRGKPATNRLSYVTAFLRVKEKQRMWMFKNRVKVKLSLCLTN